MKEMNNYLYDWNENGFSGRKVVIHDETLREGIQSLSIDISLDDKIKYLNSILQLPVSSICLGFPASSKMIYDQIDVLIPYVKNRKEDITISCAARTSISDMEPIVKLSQKNGCRIKVNAFIGISQIRQYIEQWNVEYICSLVKNVVNYAKQNGLDICIITEDSTRTSPEILKTVYATAIEAGCKNICFCDTVGASDYTGIRNLFKFINGRIVNGEKGVLVEWHGHNDRGLALENSILAAMLGANVIHATSLGIGERCGNTPLELLLLNLAFMGNFKIDSSLKKITEHFRTITDLFGYQIPKNYPVWGEDSFSTVSGIHAAAIYKALDMKDNIKEKVYSFIEPSILGRQQKVLINYMSGKSNILYWLKLNHVHASEKIIANIMKKAKTSITPLSDEDIWEIIKFQK